jgi:hypothetical protein
MALIGLSAQNPTFDAFINAEKTVESSPTSSPASTHLRTGTPTTKWTESSSYCTSTMHITPSRVCTGDGTVTSYHRTTKSWYQVDCHGCQRVVVSSPVYPCPVVPISATTTVATPYTQWSTICSRSHSISTTKPTKATAVARDTQICPTIFTVIPPQQAGRVSTSYLHTVTQTVPLSCGGCPLVISTQVQGFGPQGTYTSTCTSATTTTTAYACA